MSRESNPRGERRPKDARGRGVRTRITDFLRRPKRLTKAYIAIPTRPPTENWVEPTRETTINTAFQTFSEKLGVDRVEYLLG